MEHPWRVSFEEIKKNPRKYVSAVFSSLKSEFLVIPKGKGFIEYGMFEKAYEALKKATSEFSNLNAVNIVNQIKSTPLSLIVLRTILGFSPSEWAYLSTQKTGEDITQGYARTLERKIRLDPLRPMILTSLTRGRITALVETACHLIESGIPKMSNEEIHRLHKADTLEGAQTIQNLAKLGVPYAMLLYERFLGRPFASHRDSVSELVGYKLEAAIEEILAGGGVSFRKTKRAEKISGFDQTPDFVIPSEFNAQVVIEAKVTEDDGTARDKITRIQHLAELALKGRPFDNPKFEVIACISGRGFGVRREDMKKLLFATRGKVFTFNTLRHILKHTSLKEYRSK